MPADVLTTIALAASSVIFGLLLPLAAGLAIVGIVAALVDSEFRMLVVGLLLTVAAVAAAVALRTWGAQQLGAGSITAEQLALANQTAAVVFTAVTPVGVVLGAVLGAVGIVRRYVGRRGRLGISGADSQVVYRRGEASTPHAREMTSRARRPALAAAVLCLAFIALVTLGPPPWVTRPSADGYDVLSLSTWLDRGTWSVGRPWEFLANVLLFVPLGMLVRLGFPRGTWVFAGFVGSVVSVGVEVLQMGSARVSDPRDVVANTLGALAGAVLVAVLGGVGRGVRGLVGGGSVGGGSARPPQVDSARLLVLSKVSSTGENGVRKD